MTQRRRTFRRAFIYLQICFSFILTSASTNSMGFALVCMANQTETAPVSDKDLERSCNKGTAFGLNDSSPHINGGDYHPEFDWSVSAQNTLLSAGAWGALLAVFFSWTLDKYGAKWITLAFSGLAAVSNLVTPMAARSGSLAPLVFSRVLQGGGNGHAWPLLSFVCAHWFPGPEIGAAMGVITAGNHVGSVLNVLVAGQLCRTLGWEFIFYLWGVLLGLWCLVWCFFYTDDPHQATRAIGMNQDELSYILKHRKLQEGKNLMENRSLTIPWRSIFSSPVVWVLACVSVTAQSFYFFTNDYIPPYFKTVLFLPSSLNGILSALPMLTQAGGKICGGLLADRLTCFGETKRAKLMTFVGLIVPGTCLLGLAYLNCTQVALAVTLLAMAGFFWSFVGSGGAYRAMMLLAPRFASTLCMIAEITCFVGGVALPLIVGAIMPTYTQVEWSHTFGFLTAALASGALVYTLWGTADTQPWALGSKSSKSMIGGGNDGSVDFVEKF